MIFVTRPGFASKIDSKKNGFKVLGVFGFMFRVYFCLFMEAKVSFELPRADKQGYKEADT